MNIGNLKKEFSVFFAVVGLDKNCHCQSYTEENGKYKYGNFPQTPANTNLSYPICIYDISDDTVDEDGNYTKFAVWHDDWVLGSDGRLFKSYNDTYYLVEPIVWSEYTGGNDSSKKYLIADKILDVGSYHYVDDTYCWQWGIENKILTGKHRIGLLNSLSSSQTDIRPSMIPAQTDYAKRETTCSDWWTKLSSSNVNHGYCNRDSFWNTTADDEIIKGFRPTTEIIP